LLWNENLIAADYTERVRRVAKKVYFVIVQEVRLIFGG
jgi:hypothetical protein